MIHVTKRSVSCSHVSRPIRRVPVGDSPGVIECTCLDCFLNGGKLYRYEYSVNIAVFMAKMRGGTCTRAVSDADDLVVRRANDLLRIGFGSYNLFRNNCENFAVYCKTGLRVLDQRTMGQSGQIIGRIASPFAVTWATLQGIPLNSFFSPEWAVLIASIEMPARLLFLPMISIYAIPIAAVLLYCLLRLNADIGTRSDVVRVSVEEFARMGAHMN